MDTAQAAGPELVEEPGAAPAPRPLLPLLAAGPAASPSADTGAGVGTWPASATPAVTCP